MRYVQPFRQCLALSKFYVCICKCELILKIFYLFIFREWKGGRKSSIHLWLSLVHPLLGTWPATQACAVGWELNQWPFDLLAGTQSTEPHQPAFELLFFIGDCLRIINVDWEQNRMNPCSNRIRGRAVRMWHKVVSTQALEPDFCYLLVVNLGWLTCLLVP